MNVLQVAYRNMHFFGAYARIGLRWMLAVVFLFSALPKLQSPQLFLARVYEYELLGPDVGAAVAMAVPFVELALSGFLFAGLFTESALLLSTMVFSTFLAAEGSAAWRGLEISCGCFSVDPAQEGAVSYSSLIRTAVLLLLAFCLFFLELYSNNGDQSGNTTTAGTCS